MGKRKNFNYFGSKGKKKKKKKKVRRTMVETYGGTGGNHPKNVNWKNPAMCKGRKRRKEFEKN